jgi:hypothetical protein
MSEELMPQENKSVPKRWRKLYETSMDVSDSLVPKDSVIRMARQLIEELGAAEAAEKRMRRALSKAENFVADELECRETSYLPEPLNETEESYLADAQETLEAIRAALSHPVEEAQNG